MPFSLDAKDRMLDVLSVTRLSLHVGWPGVDGSQNEVPSAGYERQEVAFLPSNNGVRQLGAQAVFTGDAGLQVAYVGFWEDTGFAGFAAIEGDDTFGVDGKFYLETGTKLALED